MKKSKYEGALAEVPVSVAVPALHPDLVIEPFHLIYDLFDHYDIEWEHEGDSLEHPLAKLVVAMAKDLRVPAFQEKKERGRPPDWLRRITLIALVERYKQTQSECSSVRSALKKLIEDGLYDRDFDSLKDTYYRDLKSMIKWTSMEGKLIDARNRVSSDEYDRIEISMCIAEAVELHSRVEWLLRIRKSGG